MLPIPAVPGEDVVKALQKAGFELVRVRSSHHRLRNPNPDGLDVTVPVHLVHPRQPQRPTPRQPNPRGHNRRPRGCRTASINFISSCSGVSIRLIHRD
jgi:predicted RNA binding protein YcfA (HicA-like mRNA interferase family)